MGKLSESFPFCMCVEVFLLSAYSQVTREKENFFLLMRVNAISKQNARFIYDLVRTTISLKHSINYDTSNVAITPFKIIDFVLSRNDRSCKHPPKANFCETISPPGFSQGAISGMSLWSTGTPQRAMVTARRGGRTEGTALWWTTSSSGFRVLSREKGVFH